MVPMFSCLTHTAVREPDGRGTKMAFSVRVARAKPGLRPFPQILQGHQQKKSSEATSQEPGGHTWSSLAESTPRSTEPTTGKVSPHAGNLYLHVGTGNSKHRADV